MATALVKAGSSLVFGRDIQDMDGDLGLTPVMYAVLYQDMNMLTALLSTDGGLSDEDYVTSIKYQTKSHGFAAGHVAVLIGNFPALKMLFEYGADVHELRDSIQGQSVMEMLQAQYGDLVNTIEDAFTLNP